MARGLEIADVRLEVVRGIAVDSQGFAPGTPERDPGPANRAVPRCLGDNPTPGRGDRNRLFGSSRGAFRAPILPLRLFAQ
jgi:hypothetical protein